MTTAIPIFKTVLRFQTKTDPGNVIFFFYVHVTVHRNKFLYNRTNQTH